MKREKQNKSKKINVIAYLIFCLIVLFALLISKTASKYVTEKFGNPIAQESTEFYFESELASAEIKEYKNNYWDGEGTKDIEIDINNYFNNLLKTNKNITYKIKTEIIDDTADSINDSDLIELKIFDENNTEIASEQELILENTEYISEKYILKITPKTELEANKKLNIKISLISSKPYEKVLLSKVEVIIDKQENLTTLIESENGEYVTLNLDVKNTNNNITITYDPEKLQLDKSSYIINNQTITEENNMKKIVINKENLEKKIYEIIFIKLQEEEITLGTDIIIS